MPLLSSSKTRLFRDGVYNIGKAELQCSCWYHLFQMFIHSIRLSLISILIPLYVYIIIYISSHAYHHIQQYSYMINLALCHVYIFSLIFISLFVEKFYLIFYRIYARPLQILIISTIRYLIQVIQFLIIMMLRIPCWHKRAVGIIYPLILAHVNWKV